MNGELAQGIALVAHGGRWLSGDGSVPAPDFSENSTLQFVRSVTFQLGNAMPGPLQIPRSVRSTSPAEWLGQLRGRGVDGLELVSLAYPESPWAPHYLAGFSNGGGWRILATRRGKPEEGWIARWTVDRSVSFGQKPLPVDKRIWDVLYVGAWVDRWLGGRSHARVPNVGSATNRLRVAIEAAEQLAVDERWSSWAGWLEEAIAFGDGDGAQPYHQDIVPEDTALAVRRLIAMASKAWVFGGMGWWTDLSPSEGQKEQYERLTAELLEAVMQAAFAGANAAALPPDPAAAPSIR